MPRVSKKLVEYKNVTENETMFFEFYCEEDTRNTLKVLPGKSIFISDKDIRTHKDDTRFLDGKFVPVGSQEELASLKEATDIMTTLQVEYFIKNNNTPEELLENIINVRSIPTMSRLLKEAKKPEHNKTYSFVVTLENRLNELVKESEAFTGKAKIVKE